MKRLATRLTSVLLIAALFGAGCAQRNAPPPKFSTDQTQPRAQWAPPSTVGEQRFGASLLYPGRYTPTATEDVYLARASVKLGTSAAALVSCFSDWGPFEYPGGNATIGGWTITLTGAGSAGNSVPSAQRGGWFVSTTAAAGAAENTITQKSNFLPRMDTGIGYLAFRGKIDTLAANAAGAILFAMFNDAATRYVSIGIDAAYSTTKIVFKYDGFIGGGTNVDLLAANDQAAHVYEVWWTGDGKVHVSIDAVESGSGVTPTLPIQSHVFRAFETYNAAVATAQTQSEDWFLMATTRI